MWGEIVTCQNLNTRVVSLGTDGAVCRRKVANGRKVEGALRFRVNVRSLQPMCKGAA